MGGTRTGIVPPMEALHDLELLVQSRHPLVLVETGSEPRTITDEMIPLVQY